MSPTQPTHSLASFAAKERFPVPAGQRGMALVMSILFLLLLTLLGVTSMNTSVLQERMAGNMRDLEIAMQAAESSLRYGATKAHDLQASAEAICQSWDNGGLPDSFGIWRSNSVNLDLASWWNTWGVELQEDGNKQVEQAYQDPRHVIEYLDKVRLSAESTGPSGKEYGSNAFSNAKGFLRITARGVGRSAGTDAILRSTQYLACP